MNDGLEGCRAALSDVERRVRKYADEDPTEEPMLAPEPGHESEPAKRAPTKQQIAIVKLEGLVAQLQAVLVTCRYCLWFVDARHDCSC
jgi:hypothetical protein